METDRLRYFCVIAESGSLSAAAQILNVSHSGLSKAMSVLQSEINTELFRPQGRGLELTEEGRLFYPKALAIVKSVTELKNLRRTENLKKLSVGLSEVFLLRLGALLAAGAAEIGLSAEILEIDAGEVEEQVASGRLDFGITFLPFPNSEVEHLKIKSAAMGVFHTNKKFEKTDLAGLPFVVPASLLPSNPMSLKNRDGWPNDLARNEAFSVSSLAGALKIVDAGLAAVYMPQFLGENYFKMELSSQLLSTTQMSREVYLVKRKSTAETAAMKTAARLVRKHC